MGLQNTNPDTLAAELDSYLKRLEAVETVLANMPVVGQYAGVALAATEAADAVVGDVAQGVTSVEAALPAAAPQTASSAVVPPAKIDPPVRPPVPTPSPAPVAGGAPSSAVQIIAKAASALTANGAA